MRRDRAHAGGRTLRYVEGKRLWVVGSGKRYSAATTGQASASP